MNAETIAVSHITGLISRCTGLVPNINVHDTTPFTDGHIDLYDRTDAPSNRTFRGRVSVQVKGRKHKLRENKTPGYTVSGEELRGFQKISGVLYFVVFINPSSGAATPYYKLLSPFVIDKLLGSDPDSVKSVPIDLEPLSSDPTEIRRLVELGHLTQAQDSLVVGPDPEWLLADAEKFTLFPLTELDFSRPIVFDPGSSAAALTVDTHDGRTVHLNGVLEITPEPYTEKPWDLVISSGGVRYDTALVMRLDPETVRVKLAGGLTLVLTSNTASVKLSPAPVLGDRAKAIAFYLALADTGELELNGNTAEAGKITPRGDLNQLREQSTVLSRLVELFDHLGVDPNILDVNEISDRQFRQLGILHDVLIGGQDLEASYDESGFLLQPVGRWHLMFLLSAGGAPNRWRLIDPLTHPAPLQYARQPDGGDPFPITAYDVIQDDRTDTILNLHLDTVVEAYAALSEHANTTTLATYFLMGLLRAADRVPERQTELLDAAEALSLWLISQDRSEPRHVINQLQIHWRRQGLSEEQQRTVRDLKHQHSGTDPHAIQIQLACALLLNADDEASYLIQQLPEPELTEMQGWPIWNLHRGSG